MNDYKNYLPSKKFTTIILFIIVLVALFFTIKGVISLFKNKNSTKGTPTTMVVGDLIQKDSNANGIPDWEEYLWGLNPEKDGPENKEFIMSKKQTLAENNPSLFSSDTDSAKESEVLSKEFFAVVMSLVQSGNLNDESVTQVSDAIGQKIVPEPLPDIYTKEMLTINNKQDSDIAYFQALDKLNTKYADKDMGSELTILAQGLANNDPKALEIASNIALSYRSFGQELIKIPIPEKIAVGGLSLANDYEKIAQSIESFKEILDNPLVGMKAILNYKKYNEGITSDLDSISSNLE